MSLLLFCTLLLMTAMTTCHNGMGNTELENTSLSLNQKQTPVCEEVLLILCYLKLLYTAYNMTLVYSPVEGIKRSLIFVRGLVHLSAPWTLGIFFTLFILCRSWCSKQSL